MENIYLRRIVSYYSCNYNFVMFLSVVYTKHTHCLSLSEPLFITRRHAMLYAVHLAEGSDLGALA